MPNISRRDVLKGTGALIVTFTITEQFHPVLAQAQQAAPVQIIDNWLKVDANGHVTAFVGKVDLGTGIRTAFTQIVADELYVPIEQVTVILGDTLTVPNQGLTGGSSSLSAGAPPLRAAAAEARLALLQRASKKLGVSVEGLKIKNGVIYAAADSSKKVGYGELVDSDFAKIPVSGKAPLKPPSEYTVVGKSIDRVEVPNILTGGKGDYVVNVRLPGMLHARILRGPKFGSKLASINDAPVKAIPGVVAVIPFKLPGDKRLESITSLFPGDNIIPRDWVAVVAEREEVAVKALGVLEANTKWEGQLDMPTSDTVYDWMTTQKAQDYISRNDALAATNIRIAAKRVKAEYKIPFHAHGPILPTMAVADVKDGQATVYSSTQGPFMVRREVAKALGFAEEKVRVIRIEGSGLYGRNLVTDADAEAAILSQMMGRPVRLQWMRQEEFNLSPYRPARLFRLEGGVDEMGQVIGYNSENWLPWRPIRPTAGSNNINPLYGFSAARVVTHNIESPIRTGFARAVEHVPAAFAMEAFMDQMAYAAGVDPVTFRMRHLTNSRAKAVLTSAVSRSGWKAHTKPSGQGIGVAFAQYETSSAATFVAHVAEVEIDRNTGQVLVKKFTVAHDSGRVVNPNGIINQIQGGTIMATGWALHEEVKFADGRITSQDWNTYPIMRYNEIPEINVQLLNRPQMQEFGAGEPTCITPAPAIANAIYDALGVQPTQMPFTAERVKALINKA